jgi:hypothetical protein
MEQLDALKAKNPEDMIRGNSSGDPQHIQSLVPWAVCVWKIFNA